MSISTIVAAEGGAVVFYLMTETSGTNLADSSGNSLPATVQSRGSTNGSAVVTGLAASLTANGNAGAGQIASRAVTGGSPLQLSGDITVWGFVRASSATPPATGGLLGERASNWMHRRAASRIQVLYLTLDAGAGPVLRSDRPLSGTVPLATSERGLVWWRRRSSDGLTEIGTGGVIEDAAYLEGTFATVTDSLLIGSSANNGYDGQIGPYGIMNHYCDLGFLKALEREDTTLDYDRANDFGGVLFDFAGDSNALIAASSEDAICHGMYCGGRMRALEGRVTTSAGVVHHVSCRSGKLKTPPATITTSSVQEDYARRAEGIIRRNMRMWFPRGAPGKPNYMNATNRYIHATNSAGVAFWNQCGLGLPAAALARYCRTGPSDPLMKIAYAHVEMALAQDYTNGGTTPGVAAGQGWWDNADFSLPIVGKYLILLKDRMDLGQWTDWKDQYLDGHDAYYITGGPITGSATTRGAASGYAAPWYINGNREWGGVESFIYANILDPTSTRAAQLESQVAWVATPTAGSWQPGGAGSGEVFGYVSVVSPSNDDWSDGRGYFRESHGGAKGFWCHGGAVELDADNETIDVDGFTVDYCDTQGQRALSAYCFTRELRYARYANTCVNSVLNKLDYDAGIVEGSFGSRHCADFKFITGTPHVMTWRGLRQSAVTTTNLVKLWTTLETTFTSHGRAPVDATGRDVAAAGMTSLIMGLDQLPGHEGI